MVDIEITKETVSRKWTNSIFADSGYKKETSYIIHVDGEIAHVCCRPSDVEAFKAGYESGNPVDSIRYSHPRLKDQSRARVAFQAGARAKNRSNKP